MLRKYLVLVLIFLSCTLTLHATQIARGKVYRIINRNQPERSITISSSGQEALLANNNADDLKQQWYLTADDEGGFYMRNVACGGYLKSPKTTYTAWPVVTITTPEESSMLMSIEAKGDYFVFRPYSQKNLNNNQNIFAHNQGGNTLVCWNGGDETYASHWTFVEVPMSETDIEEMEKRFKDQTDIKSNEAQYQANLDALFEDKACTVLRDEVKADLQNNENYKSLPSVLKKMVDKVASGNWEETNSKAEVKDWNTKYAKKYRVQSYEPYSEGNAAASFAGIQAYTNMNNPTGILGDNEELIYVMVNDPVPDGATLYIGTAPDDQMYNSVASGVKLKQGLNILTCFGDHSHFFIYYTVNTVNGRERLRKVTDFKPITIHIEGGRLNGFFNYVGDELYGKDTREDFEYTVQRATHPMYDLLGKYVILHFHLEDTPSKPGQALQKCVKSSLFSNKTAGQGREYDPVKIMTAWDNMCFAERILMGIQNDKDVNDPYNRGYYNTIVGTGDKFEHDGTVYSLDPGFHYSDYFNNRMMGISQQGDLYMNATSWRTAFNVSTVDAILTLFCTGDIWGPAHEYGHMNQGPMNMAGTTEESNNIFSNVALFFTNRCTSRCDFISSQLKLFEENATFLQHGTWGTTRMFWQLWCYYHATGHNTKFYPRLYELLRNHPIRKTTVAGGNHNERYDKLHFAKMCCIAAGEDLTDFFTAWGFFVPLDNYLIDDYSKYNAVLTQEDINIVKEEIKAFGFDKNEAIILIDDRPGSQLPTHGEFNKEKAGELGGLDYFKENKTPSGNFGYTVDVNKVTVTADGDPAAGYIVRDKDGNLLAFSNSNTFDVSPEVAEKLMSGEATVSAVGADNNSLTVTNTVLDGSLDEKKKTLEDLLKSCNAYLEYVDPTETRVGFILPEAAKPLQELVKEAQAMLENETATSKDYTDMILKFTEEYNSLVKDESSLIQISEGASYVIYNVYSTYAEYLLTTNKTKCTIERQPDKNSSTLQEQWIFTATGEKDGYYLQNSYTGQYISPDQELNMTVGDTPRAFILQSYKNNTTSVGVFALSIADRKSMAIHVSNYNVIAYTPEAGASKWYITKISDASSVDGKIKEEYLSQLKALVTGYDKLLENVDETDSKVGFIHSDGGEKLKEFRDQVQNIIDDDSLSLDELRQKYNEELARYNAVTTSSEYVIGIIPGALYRITNYHDKNNGGVLSSNGTKAVRGFTTPSDSFANLWVFEQASSNTYYLRNYNDNKYIKTAGIANNTDLPMSDIKDAYTLIPISGEIGVYGISTGGNSNGIHMQNRYGNVYRWNIQGNYDSYWYITKIRDEEYVELREKLKQLIDDSNELIKSSGTIISNEFKILRFDESAQSEDIYSNAIYKGTNNGDIFTTWSKIFDNDINTYFHSDYSGDDSADGLDHYIRFRAPKGEPFKYFTFSYTTRNATGNSVDFYAYQIQSSVDMVNWEVLYSADKSKGDKVNTGQAVVNITPELVAPEGTQYIRFMVTKGNENRGGHPYFAISEVQIKNRPVQNTVGIPNEEYHLITEEIMLDLYSTILEAEKVQGSVTSTSDDLRSLVELLSGKKAYYESLMAGAQTIYVSVGTANDSKDADDSNDCIRQAFSSSHKNTFPGLLALKEELDPSQITVSVTPVNVENWASTDLTEENDLLNLYADVFKNTAHASLIDQINNIGHTSRIDGFFSSASGLLEKPYEKDGYYNYDMVLNIPCSGVYRVTLESKDPEYALFTEDNQLPSFDVVIYPHLIEKFGTIQGINIEGCSFETDSEHDKTIYVVKDNVLDENLGNCVLYIPGTYFANNIEVTLTPGESYAPRRGFRKAGTPVTGADASNYCAVVNLEDLKDLNGNLNMNVNVTKNGAVANYNFKVARTTVGDIDPTQIENIFTDEEVEFYTLDGLRVYNPGKGIYIMKRNGKAYKVLVP